MTSIFDRTVYTSTARFDGSARALTEAELRKLAPSVFATTKHESRSDRFQPIPTYDVVQELQRRGFSLVGAKQSVTRDASKVPFTKHLLRFRRLDDAKELTRDNTVFEVLLKNANDGTSAYDLRAGLWRILCQNSLVAETKDIKEVKVRHSGDVVNKVVEGTYQVLDQAQLLLEAPERFGHIGLTGNEQIAFAEAAHVLRFNDDEVAEGDKPAISPAQLLTIRRPEDRSNDLWTVFNRVQENAIKGGLTGRAVTDGKIAQRRTTTREIKGIDQDIRLNKGLWVLAEFFAQQKAQQQAEQVFA